MRGYFLAHIAMSLLDSYYAPPKLALAEPSAVKVLAERNPQFAQFLNAALLDSGAFPSLEEVRAANYRVVLAKGVVHYDLAYSSQTGNAAGSPLVSDLIDPTLNLPLLSLIHSVWTCKTLVEIQALLLELRALVRFSPGPRDIWQAQVTMAGHINLLLECIGRGQLVLENGDAVLDALTRNLGLRTRVRDLMEGPEPEAGESEDFEQTDIGLARTLVRNWHK